MPRLPKGRKPLRMLVGLRLTLSDFETLWMEAEAMGLDLVSYLRMLIKSHPARKRRQTR